MINNEKNNIREENNLENNFFKESQKIINLYVIISKKKNISKRLLLQAF